MTKSEFAVKQFNSGFFCSQALLEAFANGYGLDIKLARRVSSSLAGGSSLGGECGAVSAAFLVIGLHFGSDKENTPEDVENLFGKINLFAEEFKKRHGSLDCPQLLGLDLFDVHGKREFAEKQMKVTHCNRYIEDAVAILEEMTNEIMNEELVSSQTIK